MNWSKQNLMSVYLLALLPFVDTLNGILYWGGNENGLSVAVIYRLLILGNIFFGILKKGVVKNDFIPLLLILISILTSALNNLTLSYVIYVVKFVLPILFIVYINLEMNGNRLPKDFFQRLFRMWTWGYCICLFVPLVLGLGYQTYGQDTVGYKGYFYSQNDLGYVIVVLTLINYIKIINNPERWQYYIIGLLYLILAFVTGLKSVYIISILSTILVFVCVLSKARLKTLLILTLAIGVAFLAVVQLRDEMNLLLTNLVNRWMYFYNTSESFLSFFTSTRYDRIINVLSGFRNQLPFSIIFGSGLVYTSLTNTIGTANIIEMDFFDLLFQYGVIGTGATYFLILDTVKRTRADIFWKLLVYVSLVYGFIVGHIFISAFSGIIFAAVIGALYENGKQ